MTTSLARARPARRPPLAAALSLALLCAFVLMALFGDALAPRPYAQTDLQHMLLPPSFAPGGSPDFFLGTDHLGRDQFSRLLFSIRLTLLISLVGAGGAAIIGVGLGLLAGHLRGGVEAAVMTAVEVQASLPFIVFALTALAVLGNSPPVLLLIVGVNGWDNYARLTRGMTLAVAARDYVLAARALGVRPAGLYARHLLPNLAGALIVEFSLTLVGTILLESALSFLGLGVQPPLTSLGAMLGEARDYLLFAPWTSLLPGAAIFLIALAISVLGDWLRDALDPTTR